MAQHVRLGQIREQAGPVVETDGLLVTDKVLPPSIAAMRSRGPGIVERFRGFGISLSNATLSTVTGVTAATNCFSGIFLSGGALNELTGNVSIRNGNVNNPCGGI